MLVLKQVQSEKEDVITVCKAINNAFAAENKSRSGGRADDDELEAEIGIVVESVGGEALSRVCKAILKALDSQKKISISLFNRFLELTRKVPLGFVHKHLLPVVEQVYHRAWAFAQEIEEFLETCQWIKLYKRK